MGKQTYGEFSWELKREKGKRYAVINRSGRAYRKLALWQGGMLGKCSATAQVHEYINHLVMTELG